MKILMPFQDVPAPKSKTKAIEPNKTAIAILTWNLRGLEPKLPDIEDFLERKVADICAFLELKVEKFLELENEKQQTNAETV